MKATGIVRRIDDLGRIVIPKELRKNIFGRYDAEGAPMEFFINGQDIILRKYDEKSEDDVCEWKTDCHLENDKPIEWLICPHEPKRFFLPDIKFCPFCGKKIKVVE